MQETSGSCTIELEELQRIYIQTQSAHHLRLGSREREREREREDHLRQRLTLSLVLSWLHCSLRTLNLPLDSSQLRSRTSLSLSPSMETKLTSWKLQQQNQPLLPFLPRDVAARAKKPAKTHVRKKLNENDDRLTTIRII